MRERREIAVGHAASEGTFPLRHLLQKFGVQQGHAMRYRLLRMSNGRERGVGHGQDEHIEPGRHTHGESSAAEWHSGPVPVRAIEVDMHTARDRRDAGTHGCHRSCACPRCMFGLHANQSVDTMATTVRVAGSVARSFVSLATMAAFAVLSTACIPLPGGYSVAKKYVAAKSDTHVLVADDGSTCRVSEKTFADVEVGDFTTCGWSRAGETAGTGTVTGIQSPRKPPITSKPPR